jgi:23S rRNA (guanosine2251-2'-O)-methyltransferase
VAKRRAELARRSKESRPVSSRARGDRGARSTEVIAGRNAVVEALRAGVPVIALYVAERVDADERVREAVRLAADRGHPLLEAPRTELDRLAEGAVHQGVVLQVPAYDYADPKELATLPADDEQLLLVGLDGVTDPRNLGAVIRSAAAFGAHGVVIPTRRTAGMSGAAWKASAGAAARLRVARASNLASALRAYKADGIFVVGLSADASTPIAELELATEPLMLVVGAEGAGLSRLVAETCDLLVRVPMTRDIESLNAGVATGIALYEIARLRGTR